VGKGALRAVPTIHPDVGLAGGTLPPSLFELRRDKSLCLPYGISINAA